MKNPYRVLTTKELDRELDNDGDLDFLHEDQTITKRLRATVKRLDLVTKLLKSSCRNEDCHCNDRLPKQIVVNYDLLVDE